MHELTAKITGGFWRDRLDLNTAAALEHQWSMLESSLCIDNFRIAAGEKEGFREGYFFADSDAYKWLEAAARCLADRPNPGLGQRVEAFVALLGRAQAEDGYLFTYNQVHFPGSRWMNLQIEHEQYCLGLLIEAGISHADATGTGRLLAIARKAADLLVRDCMHASPARVDGHAELEIALLRLYERTGEPSYRELALRLLGRRGHIRLFPLEFLRQSLSAALRELRRRRQRRAYRKVHPGHQTPHFPSRLVQRVPPFMQARFLASLLSGRFTGQNKPARLQAVPVGHAVRFLYLETAQAMLARADGDRALLETLMRTWEHMVARRMYVTGGVGALPLIEGFGRDYELHPAIAYAETCAAIGSMLWSWQMLLATGGARYADLFEWQLYNAASVSMSLDGRSYFYDNPLASRKGLQRAGWYDVSCCPSNLSRTWASLGQHLFTGDSHQLWLHQFASCRLETADGLALSIDSGLPWDGKVCIRVEGGSLAGLHVRIPSWAGGYSLALNQVPLPVEEAAPGVGGTACGYNPDRSTYAHITASLKAGDVLEMEFSMKVRIYRQDKRLPQVGRQVAVGRGPLIYCLESIDNPDLDIFNLRLEPSSLQAVPSDLLGGCMLLLGLTSGGKPFTMVPYMLWANRGPSRMNIFIRGTN